MVTPVPGAGKHWRYYTYFEAAVEQVLEDDLRTADLYEAGTQKVSTTQMGDAVVAKINQAEK